MQQNLEKNCLVPSSDIPSCAPLNREILRPIQVHTYLLLTEFAGRTVSYGPSFSPSIFRAWAINRRGKGSGTYSTDQENEIFIISLVCV